MSDILTVRHITPVFNFELASQKIFSHQGVVQGVNFELTLKQYQAHEYQELLQSTDLEYIDCFKSQVIWESRHFFGQHKDYYLVIDVFHQTDTPDAINSPQSSRINSSAEQALRLHTTKGYYFGETHTYRSTKPTERSGDSMPQYSWNHLGFKPPSSLTEQTFDACKTTMDILLKRQWGEANVMFDKVLRLALSYHKTAFKLEKVEHSFLLLMVVFEALFKKDQKENKSHAWTRMANLLAYTQKEAKAIKTRFEKFGYIRNAIAHGEPTLKIEEVKQQYPLLYQDITQAIIQLLRITSLDLTQNYYDELIKYLDKRFQQLPRK